MKLNLKPLSANRMFYRNKNKTVEYRQFQEDVRDLSMGKDWPFGTDPVQFEVNVGLSSKAADLDNCIKPILDTYQNIYDDFNDNKVYKIVLRKEIVEKGKEYVDIKIHPRTVS